MRIPVLLSAAVLLTSSCFAQPKTPAGKTTSSNQRLVCQVTGNYTNGTYVSSDSTVYNYTGQRVWDDKTQSWKFDDMHRFSKNLPTQTVFNPLRRGTHTYDANGNISVYEDERYDDGKKSWEKYAKTTYTYTNSGLISNITFYQSVNGKYQGATNTTYTYDASSRPIEELTLIWDNNSNNWINSTKKQYLYTSAGLSATNTEQWIRINWTPWLRETYIYNNGKLSVLSEDRFLTNIWTNISRTQYDYTSNNQYSRIYHLNWNNVKQQLDTTDKIEYAYAPDNSVTATTSAYTNGQFVNQRLDYTANNSDDQPLVQNYQEWDAANNKWLIPDNAWEVRYYYSMWNLDVNTVKNNNTTLTIYPIPANNFINISLKTEKGSWLRMDICNTEGKLLQSWSQPAIEDRYEERRDISFLPAGNYVLRLVGEREQAFTKFTVIK